MSVKRAIEILETLLSDKKEYSVTGMQYAIRAALTELDAELQANPPPLGIHVSDDITPEDIMGGGR